jgi:hypothetical protein
MIRRRVRLTLFVVVVFSVLALGIYVIREQLERAVIAYRVYRSRIFTPPPPNPAESGWLRPVDDVQFYWDFSELHVARERRLKKLNPSLRPLVKEVERHQAAGEGMQYSMHIYREIRWRLNFTPDVESTQTRIADLRQSLLQPEQQELATQQQPSDGSWGLGINVWYLKLYYSVEDGLDNGAISRYPLAFLNPINSPDKLTAHLDSVLLDDFTKTGVFNREELDETFSALARLLFKTNRIDYPFHPGLQSALREFVMRWQNPVSGCWGQWMIDRQGRVWKMDDMAMTFHVISDLQGQVEHLDRIAKRVLTLDEVNFPAGIRFNGHYENHLNWDVVKIFRYAWPNLDEITRKQVRAEISSMLNWCLTQSYQPDGSFKVSELDDTLGDAYNYGVSFLRDTGYFQRGKRFWTDEDFPSANVVRERIMTKLQSIGLNDPGLKDAYESLSKAQSSVTTAPQSLN